MQTKSFIFVISICFVKLSMIRNVFFVFLGCIKSLFYLSVYPIQERCPSLHGDTLEDGDAGKDNVVKRGDPKVWTLKQNLFDNFKKKFNLVLKFSEPYWWTKEDLPFLKAYRCGGVANISSGRRAFWWVPVAGDDRVPIADYFVWKNGSKVFMQAQINGHSCDVPDALASFETYDWTERYPV